MGLPIHPEVLWTYTLAHMSLNNNTNSSSSTNNHNNHNNSNNKTQKVCAFLLLPFC